MFRTIRNALALTGLVLPSLAGGQNVTPAYNAIGLTGLVDMPSAWVQPDGETAWSLIYGDVISGGVLSFQALPRLETSVSFLRHEGYLGSPLGNPSLNLKYQVSDEHGSMPALAIGVNNLFANSADSSEYIVASKSIADGLLASAGLGWGRYGSNNPIGSLGTRPPVDPGNVAGVGHLFRGDMALFGGLIWDTPIKNVSVAAEYSSDAYTNEDFVPSSPFNFALNYAPAPGIQLSAYRKYGSETGFRLTFHGNPFRPYAKPDLGAGPLPLQPRPAGYSTDTSWAQVPQLRARIGEALRQVLAEEGATLVEAKVSGAEIEVYISNPNRPRLTKTIGRVARALAASAPPSVDVFKITPVMGGLATNTIVIRRSDMEAQVDRPGAGADSWVTAHVTEAPNSIAGADWVQEIGKPFNWNLSPSLPVNLFSSSGDLKFAINLNLSASYRVNRGLSFNGNLSQKLFGEEFEAAAPDPGAARSDSGAFDRSGPQLNRLTVDYVFKPSPSVYGRITAGYLERQYGGVSGEVLWKPADSDFAVGGEVNYARKRAYEGMFGFQDFSSVTGHVSFYWDTGYRDIEAQLDLGRYLAGDWGGTVSVSRQFANGWEVSGYFTITEDNAGDLNSTNFDKGIRVTIPLDWTLPFESRSKTSVSMAGVNTDAGARLMVPGRLYATVEESNTQNLYETWGAFWQ